MAKKSKSHKKLDFAQKLAEKLRGTGSGTVEEGSFNDKSGRWVTIRNGATELCFSFDMKGEQIDRIALYKDKIEVVDQVKIWSNTL